MSVRGQTDERGFAVEYFYTVFDKETVLSHLVEAFLCIREDIERARNAASQARFSLMPMMVSNMHQKALRSMAAWMPDAFFHKMSEVIQRQPRYMWLHWANALYMLALGARCDACAWINFEKTRDIKFFGEEAVEPLPSYRASWTFPVEAIVSIAERTPVQVLARWVGKEKSLGTFRDILFEGPLNGLGLRHVHTHAEPEVRNLMRQRLEDLLGRLHALINVRALGIRMEELEGALF